MKIERFNEAKIDPFVGEVRQRVEVEVIFRVNRSSGYPASDPRYSLRVKIQGIPMRDTGWGKHEIDYWKEKDWIRIGTGFTKEQIEENKEIFLSNFSVFHQDIDKYNL